ncbi:hypothetical protein F383_38021 [Gossypium arboreum]|uniref:Uncharacterized protein n=1 Tax=Gossypium arboreum TaxID=29729 RepID=A0A0B0MJ26_GOSAR|nr:hypothetical protein F383_38021 [Gossypium arboreum]
MTLIPKTSLFPAFSPESGESSDGRLLHALPHAPLYAAVGESKIFHFLSASKVPVVPITTIALGLYSHCERGNHDGDEGLTMAATDQALTAH